MLDAIREALAALITDLDAHDAQEGEHAEFRNPEGAWEDTADRVRAIQALLPKPAGGAVALLTDDGVTEDGRRVLIHVWADGTGELAYAPQGTTSWGNPWPLVPAP